MIVKIAVGSAVDCVKWLVKGTVGCLLYGVPMTVTSYFRRAQAGAKIKEVGRHIKKLATPTVTNINYFKNSIEGPGIEGRLFVEQTPGTRLLQLELFERLKKRHEAEFALHDREFMRALCTLIPVAGTLLVNRIKDTTDRSSAQAPPSLSHLFFPGQVKASLYLPGLGDLLLERQAKTFWEEHGGKSYFVSISYVDERGAKATRKIEAMHLIGTPEMNCSGIQDKTVVISHGSGTLYTNLLLAKKYQSLGYNVFCYTMGGNGYPQVDPPLDANNRFETSELTIYQDVDGVMQQLKKMGVREVLWHGQSIGAAAMGYAGERYGKRGHFPQEIVVEQLIIDQAFTTGEAVIANFAKNFLGFEHRALGATLGREASCSGVTDGQHMTTGLNILSRLTHLQDSEVRVAAIVAPQDHLNGYQWNQSYRRYDANFAIDLLEARYPNGTRPSNSLLLLDPHATHEWTVADDIQKIVPMRSELP